ncbi:MAG: YigZ family protein [Anaerolineales bacterium]|nr:YigZ family protein [Anaerolineales bacterium]
MVTRYFGGTKLGTGGLVRAYGDAVKAVLAILPLAEKVPTHTVGIEMPYSFLERARRLVAAHNGEILDESFLAEITLTVRFHQAHLDDFAAELAEAANGTIEPVILESDDATIMPLPGPQT